MFSLCLFPFVVSHVVVLLNFAHELLCTTRVRQPEDFRRNKLILIILPTQDKKKKKNIYYKVCPGSMGAIQCSAKRVYPFKDFRYHLLTKNRQQYLKDRVFNNFAVRLRKSLLPEKG